MSKASSPSTTTLPLDAAASNLSQSAGHKGIFRIFDHDLAPVESATYRTINFQSTEERDFILYSSRLTACPILLIKNYNPETKKYDSVVTMAHFFPNNAYDEETANSHITLAVKDFLSCGGTLNERTSVQLLGGYSAEGEKIEDTARGVLSRALDQMGFKKMYKFSEHTTSINKLNESTSIFVDRLGTQIVRRFKTTAGSYQNPTLITAPSDSMPLSFLEKIDTSCFPPEYSAFVARGLNIMAAAAQSRFGPMPMTSMADMLRLFDSRKARAAEESKDGGR